MTQKNQRLINYQIDDYDDGIDVKKAVGDFNKKYNLKIKIYMDTSFLMQK